MQLAPGSTRKWDTFSCDVQPFNAAICRGLSALVTFPVCTLMNFYLFEHAEDRKIRSELALLYSTDFPVGSCLEIITLSSCYVPEL